MWKDARIGFRRWRRRPGATLVALVTLALGIGISASVLSLVRAVLLRPLPFKDSARLVRVASVNAAGTEAGTQEAWPVSYPDYVDWRARSRTLSDLSVFTDGLLLKAAAAEGPEMIPAEMVSAGYFRLLGVEPILGRAFLPDEDTKPGANNVAVLGYDLWRQRFQGDRAVLGKTLDLEDTPYIVIGVLPAGFRGLSDSAQLWIPISMATIHERRSLEERKFRWLSVVGRLQTGQSVQSASREMDRLAAELAREYPDTNDDIGAAVDPLASVWFGRVRPLLLLLLGGSVLVLLIVYGNLSNLWLAEGIARRPEISLRTALGASLGRLARQLLTETLLLTFTGTALGLLASALALQALVRTTEIYFRSFVHLGIDAFVVGVILGTTLLFGLLFGIIPVLLGIRAGLRSVSSAGEHTMTMEGGRRWLQSLLIVYEVALATILLLGAGSLTTDFLRHSRLDLGFRADHLLTLRTNLQGQSYAQDERMRSMILQVVDRLHSVPGVSSVTAVGPAIPTDPWHAFRITLENRPELEAPLIVRHHISPAYFRTLGVPVIKGRDFSFDDRESTTLVVVISQAMSRRFWPRENPLGKRLKLGPSDSKFPWLTVVGVVGDLKHEGKAGEAGPGPDLYLPLLQSLARNPPVLNLVVRSSVPPESLAPALIRELHRAAPDLPVYDVRTMEERLAKQISEIKILTTLMIGSALLALMLSLIGVYGVISCAIGHRIRELGIRMVLGAKGRDLTYLLVGQGLRLALIGAGCGVLLALALNRLTTGVVQGIVVLPAPSLVAGTSVVVIGLVVLTCYVPVQRALRGKSVVALVRGNWSEGPALPRLRLRPLPTPERQDDVQSAESEGVG